MHIDIKIKPVHLKKKLDKNIRDIVADTGFHSVTKKAGFDKQYMALSPDHVRVFHIKNGSFTKEAHYRNGKLSSMTRWYHGDDHPQQGQYKQVVRNFFGMQFDVTGIYKLFESQKRTAQPSFSNY